MIRVRSKLPIAFVAGAVAALLSMVPVALSHAGNGGDSEEQGTPSPDPIPPGDGDEDN